MAETLLTDPELPGDGLALTTEILSSIDKKSAVKSFATLAALVRATCMKGDKEPAVQLQEQAIKIQAPYVTEEHRQKHGDKYHPINVGNQKRLQAQLASYAAGKLPPSERKGTAQLAKPLSLLERNEEDHSEVVKPAKPAKELPASRFCRFTRSNRCTFDNSVLFGVIPHRGECIFNLRGREQGTQSVWVSSCCRSGP